MDQATSSLLADYQPREEFATEQGISLRTEARWRAAGVAPPYIKLAKKVWYRREGVREWRRQIEIRPVRLGKVKSR